MPGPPARLASGLLTMAAPILYVINSLGDGGMERQVCALTRALDPSRFQPHVASVRGGFQEDDLRAAGIPVIRIPIQSFFRPGPFALGRFLSAYIREHGIRLLHLFDAGQSLIALLGARRSGIPLITSQRSHMDIARPLYRWLLLRAHRRAAAVVGNSEAMRRHLRDDYHLPSARVELCPNGVDTAVFQPGSRTRLDALADASLVIGCVCVLRPEKNLGHLLQAFERVRGAAPGSRLLIVGSGPEGAGLRQQASDLGIASDCCFLPRTSAVADAFRSIDIFVHPSLSESLPNAVMEAMASGCCVIASSAGGTPELIESGKHGLLFPPGDLDALVDRLSSAIRQPELRRSLAANAVQRIACDFSIAQSACTMQQIYEKHLAEY